MSNRWSLNFALKYIISPFVTFCLLASGFWLLTPACGYHNPYVRNDGSVVDEKYIYLDIWPNKTNELSLETEIYQTLREWFQSAPDITITSNREKAGYFLAGEIHSINKPVLTYGLYDQAVEVNVILTISFQLKKKSDNIILHARKNLTYDEAARVESDAVTTRGNRREALSRIVADLAELVYLDTLSALFPRSP